MERTCKGCHETKPLIDFARSKRMKDDRSNWCRACYNTKRMEAGEHSSPERRAYQKDWRDKNKEHALIYQREWRRKRLIQIRGEAIVRHGGKCLRCGLTDVRVLQFDHINGGGSQERKTNSQLKILTDIANGKRQDFQLLCANCHVLKTYHE